MKDHLDPLGLEPDFIDGMGMSPFTLTLDPPALAACASTSASATVDVDITADPGFTDPVALSATGEPAGATVAFVPASVTPPGSSVLTFGSLASATPGQYAVTITGTSGSDSTSKTLSFALNDAGPGAVSLVSPANGASSVSTGPLLSWSAASSGGPTGYLVEVATDNAFTDIVFTQDVQDATSVQVAPPLANSTDYFWRVTAGNACGDAAASPVFSFRTLGAPGECKAPAEPAVVFADDVDNGENGWTTTGSDGPGTWTISEARANSPTHAWYAEDYDELSDQRLISPTIALPANQNPLTLEFQTWYLIEQNGASACYDGGILEVSNDGGATFTQVPGSAIFAGGGYHGPVDDGFDNPLQNLDAWCSDPARPFTDGPVRVDVTNYAGQDVQFRFRLGTDGSVGKEGWYIDDVSVNSCATALEDLIFADGFDGTP